MDRVVVTEGRTDALDAMKGTLLRFAAGTLQAAVIVGMASVALAHPSDGASRTFIVRAVQAARASVQRCLHPRLSGLEIHARVHIQTDDHGHPIRVELRSASPLDSATGQCLVRVFLGLEFGPAVGARVFEIPLELSFE